MAADFTQIDRTDSAHTEAQNLLSAVAQLRAAAANISAVRDRMIHCQDGTTYTLLESIFGVPSGQGSHIFLLCDGAVQAMDGSGYFQDLINSVG